MYFDILHARLLDALKRRIRNGEFTERRLAAMAGISQPHVHNALKGVRTLSPELADRILKTLKLSVVDLLEPDELGSRTEPGGLTPQAVTGLLEQARALRRHAGAALAEAESVSSLSRSLAGAAHADFLRPAGAARKPVRRAIPRQRLRDLATSS